MGEGRSYRFRDFVLDVGAYELRRRNRPVRLEQQPLDLLILLVERHGQLVSRSEIAQRLWSADVFVDVDTGIHTAVRKVRRALRDSVEAPAFVETVPGRGYRFIAPVETSPIPGISEPGAAARHAGMASTTVEGSAPPPLADDAPASPFPGRPSAGVRYR